MNIRRHNIQLKDTSESEMARFRQIMLGIWRQQIEDDRNGEEMLKYVESSQLDKKELAKLNLYINDIRNYDPNKLTQLHAKTNNFSKLWKYNSDIVAWTNSDILKWKAKGKDYLFKRKAEFVKYYSPVIKHAAKINEIPAFLLAGIAFTEFGGKPDWLKKDVRSIREFDWNGPDFIDKNLTITNHPDKTSFGDMAIQLGRAGTELDYSSLTKESRDAIQESLLDPVIGIYIAAMHVKRLKNADFKNISVDKLTEKQIQIIASRYNRGLELPIEQIKQNISYGTSIYKHKEEIDKALGK
ncbi:MAG: hypothetical protein ABI892_10590 [Flavobacterium sp.]